MLKFLQTKDAPVNQFFFKPTPAKQRYRIFFLTEKIVLCIFCENRINEMAVFFPLSVKKKKLWNKSNEWHVYFIFQEKANTKNTPLLGKNSNFCQNIRSYYFFRCHEYRFNLVNSTAIFKWMVYELFMGKKKEALK